MFSANRRLAFAIPEPLVLAVLMALDGVETYTASVALWPVDDPDDEGVAVWTLEVGGVMIVTYGDELPNFRIALEVALLAPGPAYLTGNT